MCNLGSRTFVAAKALCNKINPGIQNWAKEPKFGRNERIPKRMVLAGTVQAASHVLAHRLPSAETEKSLQHERLQHNNGQSHSHSCTLTSRGADRGSSTLQSVTATSNDMPSMTETAKPTLQGGNAQDDHDFEVQVDGKGLIQWARGID